MLMCLSLTGCSSLIIGSGKYRDVLRYEVSRNEIRARIGTPIDSGELTDGDLQGRYDWFSIQGRVIPNEWDMTGYVQGIVLTFGLFEVLFLPASIVMVPMDATKPHNLWVYYDENDMYIIHESDCWPFKTDAPNTH